MPIKPTVPTPTANAVPEGDNSADQSTQVSDLPMSAAAIVERAGNTLPTDSKEVMCVCIQVQADLTDPAEIAIMQRTIDNHRVLLQLSHQPSADTDGVTAIAQTLADQQQKATNRETYPCAAVVQEQDTRRKRVINTDWKQLVEKFAGSLAQLSVERIIAALAMLEEDQDMKKIMFNLLTDHTRDFLQDYNVNVLFAGGLEASALHLWDQELDTALALGAAGVNLFTSTTPLDKVLVETRNARLKSDARKALAKRPLVVDYF